MLSCCRDVRSQAVLEERLVVVAGSKLEAYFRRDILPAFALAFAKIAAACRALSFEVRGTCQKQARAAVVICQTHPNSSSPLRPTAMPLPMPAVHSNG